MPPLAPRPPEDEPAYLDRPQRLGWLLTTAWWKRLDVKRHARVLIGGFVVFWFTLIDLFASGLPLWARVTLMLGGLYLFQTLLERYIRARLRARTGALPRGKTD